MDALVIGAGAAELVCAHYLARAGCRVRVLEGGGAGGEDAFEEGWIAPPIVRDLALARRGFALHRSDPWATVALADGGRLELWHDIGRTAAAIGRLSARDGARWPEFCERMARLAQALERLYRAPPPDPLARGARALGELAALALRVRGLGRGAVAEFLRLLPMPVADWLEEWFECEALKGALAAAGVTDLHFGPRAGGTAFNLLHRHVGSPAGVFRPPRSNLRRVLETLPGITIRRGAEVARIRVRAGRAVAVALDSGEEIAASVIVSGLDPRRTLLGILDPGWLDPDLARAFARIRARGVAAQVRLALERAPGFGRLVLAPALDYLERAHDEAKYGGVSRAPYLEALALGAAADGRHRVALRMQYVPCALAEGEWDEARRRALGAAALEALRRRAPELGEATVEQVLAPPDLQAAYGWPEGQPQHAELAPDQLLWLRPHPALARYRTPVAGLYLCGPAMHPGAVGGAAGWHAAREIVRDLRRGVVGR